MGKESKWIRVRETVNICVTVPTPSASGMSFSPTQAEPVIVCVISHNTTKSLQWIFRFQKEMMVIISENSEPTMGLCWEDQILAFVYFLRGWCMSISRVSCITSDLPLSKWRLSSYSNGRQSEVEVWRMCIIFKGHIVGVRTRVWAQVQLSFDSLHRNVAMVWSNNVSKVVVLANYEIKNWHINRCWKTWYKGLRTVHCIPGGNWKPS